MKTIHLFRSHKEETSSGARPASPDGFDQFLSLRLEARTNKAPLTKPQLLPADVKILGPRR
jgi:hypothetical protein